VASEALRGARRARPLGAPARYLEALTLLGYLSDTVTADLRLWQSRRVLRVVAATAPDDLPLLQLADALRAAIGGQPQDAVAGLARAFYHARSDVFIAGRILAVPLVDELSPGLTDEARKLLGRVKSTPTE
jgi:hypothetical protein